MDMNKIVIFSSLLLGLVFFTGCAQQPISQNQMPTSSLTTQSSAQDVGATTDWKEYTSIDLGINFKYPANYYFMDRLSSEEKSILIGDKKFEKFEDSISPYYHAPISIWKYDDKLSNDTTSLSNIKKSISIVGGQFANIIEGNYQSYPAPGITADKHIKIISIPSKGITILSQDAYAGGESDWNEISLAVSKLLTTIKFLK